MKIIKLKLYPHEIKLLLDGLKFELDKSSDTNEMLYVANLISKIRDQSEKHGMTFEQPEDF